MSALKRLEVFAKLALARIATILLWRPGFRARAAASLARPRRILLARIDDRVGEALLTTPLVSTLRTLDPRPEIHLLVHAKAVRVLDGHPEIDRLIPFDRRRLWLGALAPGIRALRRARYDVVVNCANWEAPSVTSALVCRLVGARSAILGPARAPLAAFASHPVPLRTDTRSEVLQRLHLLSPLHPPREVAALSFRATPLTAALAEWLDALERPFAVINPGGRLGWRRISPEAFAAAAREVAESGLVPVITWGPGEEPLAREVVDAAPNARLAPPTDLSQLAALMRHARFTVCNNTGPMHLSVAVGTPTLGLFLRMEIARWGHSYPPHRMVDLTPVAGSGREIPRAVAEATRAFASVPSTASARLASGGIGPAKEPPR